MRASPPGTVTPSTPSSSPHAVKTTANKTNLAVSLGAIDFCIVAEDTPGKRGSPDRTSADPVRFRLMPEPERRDQRTTQPDPNAGNHLTCSQGSPRHRGAICEHAGTGRTPCP